MRARQTRQGSGSRFKRAGGALVAALALAAPGVALSGGSGAAAPPGGSADLSIAKTDSPDPVSAGGALTYTLSVHDGGPSTATGVVATDRLPNGVTFVSAHATGGGTCSATKLTVTCDLGTLGTNGGSANADVTINVMAPAKAGDITNTASVRADQKDTKQKNNRASATTTVTGPAPPARPTCHGHAATIVGTPGDDTLTGTGGRDVVVARRGNDRIATDGGRDTVCAGPGNDIVSAGGRADFVKGGRGADKLRGGGGNDSLHGGRGPDRLRGGPGDDLLAGGPGDDICKGGPGHDVKRSC
jgi:uncharacterized repeat protein (TIGR01451 family)